MRCNLKEIKITLMSTGQNQCKNKIHEEKKKSDLIFKLIFLFRASSVIFFPANLNNDAPSGSSDVSHSILN